MALLHLRRERRGGGRRGGLFLHPTKTLDVASCLPPARKGLEEGDCWEASHHPSIRMERREKLRVATMKEKSVVMPHDLLEAEMIYLKQRKQVSSLRKRLKKIKANRKFSEILEFQKLLEAKITHLEEKKARINSRISRMQPSGWKEFLQVVRVLEDADAVMKGTHRLLSLGETAAGLRGENELWLAVAFSHSLFITLSPSQLAAVCGSLVSEGLKLRSDFNSSGVCNVSETVEATLLALEERRQWLLGLQTKHFVEIPCELDDRFAGFVEAWASGVTWKELMMDCVLDEGDVARLLRRSIDLLAQIPFLEHLNPAVKKNARIAAALMDRSPISELFM